MMLRMQPNRLRENKKYFTEFSSGLEDLERKTNHRNISETIRTCSQQ